MDTLKKLVSACSAAVLGLNLAAVSPLSTSAGSAGIVINEICAKNTVYAANDGSYYDWIELYNNSGSQIDLGGYGLSDNETNPYKFTFPNNTIVNAGGRVMVFCDSKVESIPGQLLAPMGLSTNGETILLTDRNGSLVDTITFGEIDTNVSYGRVTDGSDEFAYMSSMTPNAANEKRDIISIDVAEPVLSQPGGFYNNSFSLSINIPSGTRVYYTLDGSKPDTSSMQYNSPIQVNDLTNNPNDLSAITEITPNSWNQAGAVAPPEPVDKAFIINAVAVDSNGNYSDVVTGTYFIGYQNRASYYNNGTKIISIVTDRDNLFDYNRGIYVLGAIYGNGGGMGGMGDWGAGGVAAANYTQKGREWEREATLQVYEDGQLAHSQNVGLRIHGAYTRTCAQKSFNVYTRSEYGASKFEFDLFSGNLRSEVTGKKIKKFDTFVLRNAGNDAERARFRDKLNQILAGGRDYLTQATEPSIVFINGEYWGHYEIYEKVDEDYIDAHYDVGAKNVCLIKNSELESGQEETFQEWKELDNWAKSTDMSVDSNYRELCEKVDIQSFIDYICAEIYLGNNDWPNNNYALWKSTKYKEGNEYSDGKWRFILYDTEYNANIYNQVPASTNSFNNLNQKDSFCTRLMRSAMKNPEFKRLFCTTFMDMANTNFATQRALDLIDKLASEYRDMSIDTHDRFWATTTAITTTTTTTMPGQTTTTAAPGPAGPGAGPGAGGWGGIGGGDWGGIGGGDWGGIGGGDWGGIGGGNWGGVGGAQISSEENYNNEISLIRGYFNDRYQSITGNLRNFASLSGNLANITVRNNDSQGSVKVNTASPDFSGGSWSGKYYTDYPVVLSVEPKQGYRFSYWETSTGEKITARTAEITLTSDMTVTAVYTQGGNTLIGDVNLNGSLDAGDLVLLQKYIHGSQKLSSDQLYCADVNNDGKVNIFDMIKLRKLLTR